MVTLTSIVQEIDRRAETREVGRLQKIRQELKGLVRLPCHGIFHPQTIFEEGEGSYAFHYGGRNELQFNVGFEPKKRLRHGVAFSFEPSRALPDPELLVPLVERFNEFLTFWPRQFADMLMWRWDERGRSADYPPSPIEADLVRSGVFVFMGRMQPLSAIDYDVILQDFDRLLPLYHFVEGTDTFPAAAPKRRGFQFKSGCTVKATSASASLAERKLNIDLRHNQIQKALHDRLASLYGPENVGTELRSADGQVDVVVRRAEKFWFYEIKTALSARGCLRQALAQLLEYCYWPGAQLAEKLIVVGEPALDNESEGYLANLREHLSMQIEYERFQQL